MNIVNIILSVIIEIYDRPTHMYRKKTKKYQIPTWICNKFLFFFSSNHLNYQNSPSLTGRCLNLYYFVLPFKYFKFHLWFQLLKKYPKHVFYLIEDFVFFKEENMLIKNQTLLKLGEIKFVLPFFFLFCILISFRIVYEKNVDNI